MNRPSAGTVLAPIALFVALGGPAEAAKVINGKTIKKDTVTSKQIKARSITLSDLSLGTRSALVRTPLGSIGSAELRDGGIATVDLGDNQVNGTKVDNNSLTGDDIAPNAIGGDEIAEGAVGVGDVRDNAVRSGEIADGSVGAAEIADGTVGAAEVGADAIGASEIAPSAVSGARVADGSLDGKDVGRFSQRLDLVLSGDLDEGDCAAVVTPALTAVAAGANDIRDDSIILTPRDASLADGIFFTVRAASANTLRVSACNLSAGDNVNLGPSSFNLTTIDVG